MIDIPAVSLRGATPARTLRLLFLTLFLRGRSGRGTPKEGAPPTVASRLGLILTIYVFVGALMFSLSGQPVFTLAVYLHTFTFIFLGMFVASSAGDVLFNKEESDILLHRPIAPRDLLMSKVAMLVRIAFMFAAALNLVGLFVGVGAPDGGWLFLPVHALSTAMEALFCVGCVVLTYQLCLRFFGRERLDALMTTTQVLIAIVAVIGGQIVPRVMMRDGGTHIVTTRAWWVTLIPPAWFAGIDDALAGTGAGHSWVLALCAVAGTAIVLWLAFGLLAETYQSGLQTIGESPSRANERPRGRVLEMLVRSRPFSWWLRDPATRGSFRLSIAYMVRDRDTKLRLYPGLAPMMVYPLIILAPIGVRSGVTDFGIAFAGCYLGLLPLMAIDMLERSQQWQAADVFRAAPVAGPAALSAGARRAVLLLLAAPVAVVLGALTIVLARGTASALMLVPGLIALPIYALIPCLGGNGVPLSRPVAQEQGADRMVRMFGVMILSGLIAGAALWARHHDLLGGFLIGEALLAAVAVSMLNSAIARAPWRAEE
jgi:hypothetical protein